MKDERYIKDKLNESIDDIAPDILQKILAHPIEPVKSLDEDLRDEPLFLDEYKAKKRWFIPSVVASCALFCMVLITLIAQRNIDRSGDGASGDNTPQMRQACIITMDVNPSIDFEVNEKGQVVKAVANNKDAKQIVKKLNKKIGDGMTVEKTITYSVKLLKKSGYLKKKTGAVLVSVEESGYNCKKNLKKAKKAINDYKKENKGKFVTVYQVYKDDDSVDAVAKKNKVSKAKAAYCMKIAEKTDVKCEKLCKETIATITEPVIEQQIDIGEDVEIYEDIISDEEIGNFEDEIDEVITVETTEENTDEGLVGDATGEVVSEETSEIIDINQEETTLDSQTTSEPAVEIETKVE